MPTSDPFEAKLKQIADRLPPDKLKRLIDLLKQYQGGTPEDLPPHIMHELNEIIDIGEGRASPRETITPTHRDDYFARMPDSQKIRIVEQVMNHPASTIPKEVIPNLPDEMKLDLFDKLVKDGVIE